MFTGIIQDVGEIHAIQSIDNDLRFDIKTNKLDTANWAEGDSIAVNGVCLTMIAVRDNILTVDVSRETTSCTTLGLLSKSSKVNLEPALTPTTALGGHLVSGHVDGVCAITRSQQEGQSTRYFIEAPESLAHFIASKGCVTLDGVSLTVNSVEGCRFDVNIIPHTMENTIFNTYVENSKLNIEVDIIARYVQRLSAAHTS